MQHIGKTMAAALAVITLSASAVPALSVSPGEIEEQISACAFVKNTAHQMAECARELGYGEDHVIIREAQGKWWAAEEEEAALREQLDAVSQPAVPETTWTGSKLTKRMGVNYGPTGKETYYNLPMSGVVRIMRNQGFSEAEYPYWVRDDGCKMLGDYIMVAANLNVFPRGSVVECSLGMALVCDTGGFAKNNPYQLDIAVNW